MARMSVQAHKSTLVTTNKPFAEWAEVFPNAICVITIVDRLLHRCELTSIEAASYRLKECLFRRIRPPVPKLSDQFWWFSEI